MLSYNGKNGKTNERWHINLKCCSWEIEYKKKEIIDKINSFFGYNCISQITLRITQDKSKSKNKSFTKIKNLSKIEEKMNNIKNVSLKNSLSNLLKAFNENKK